MKLKMVFAALAMAMLICTAGTASADLIDLQETGVLYSDTVNVTGSQGAASITNTSVYAGLYQILVRDPSRSTEAFMPFDAYCVDPQFAPSGSVQYVSEPIAAGSKLAAAAQVLSQGYTSVAAEAQAAVWKLTWDSFTVNSGFSPEQLTNMTNIYVAALAHQATFDTADYFLASNGCTQDYIYHSNPVPLPPSVLLLGSGLLGLLGLRRWRKNALAA